MAIIDRLTAVFRRRVDCSSGSDHSPENSAADLFDLVKSFIERDDDDESREREKEHNTLEESDGFSCNSDAGVIELQNLFGSRENNKEIDAKKAIRVEVQQAIELLGGRSLQGFKRQLMAHLRRKGFDAGLCKSKLEKLRSFPAGEHEYIDVNFEGNRYIVENFLVREFEIARPTSQYTSLLNNFPEIFVGNLEELKQVVRLMCSAMKKSMKMREMHAPPWRRKEYMQAKWSGSYKRTTNEAPTHKVSGSDETEESCLVCFKASPAIMAYHCRGDFGRNAGLKVGNLTAAFGGNGLML